jgi:hypothetical protein
MIAQAYGGASGDLKHVAKLAAFTDRQAVALAGRGGEHEPVTGNANPRVIRW